MSSHSKIPPLYEFGGKHALVKNGSGDWWYLECLNSLKSCFILRNVESQATFTTCRIIRAHHFQFTLLIQQTDTSII